MSPVSFVAVALLALVAWVDAASVGDACECPSGINGTLAAADTNATTTSTTVTHDTSTSTPTTTTTAAATTTAAPAGNKSNASRRVDELSLVGGPARQLDVVELQCVCTSSTTSPAPGTIVKKVVKGELSLDFGSARRLQAEEFLAAPRKLLYAADVKSHVEAGLKNSTGQAGTTMTACVRQSNTDVFHAKYEIELASDSDANAVTAKLANLAKAGADFDAFKAAVAASGNLASLNLTIAAPPTVLSAPTVTTKYIQGTTTTSVRQVAISGACPGGAVGAMLGLAALVGFAH